MDNIKSVNFEEVTVIINKFEALERREARLDNTKSTNLKYIKDKREELLRDYKNLLMWCLLNGYSYNPRCRGGIVGTIVGELQDAVDRNTLRLKQ